MPSNPPLQQTHALGSVELSPRVVSALAARITEECYGVAGMAARGLRDGIAELLNRENVARGIELRIDEQGIEVELYIVVEHGVRILEVAHNLMSAVSYGLQHNLGIRVLDVNVNVQGIRLPDRRRGGV
jgi:uncharacterized alkaline shock family protein YloU